MEDLYLGLLIVAMVSIGAFVLAWKLTQQAGKMFCDFLALLTLTGIVAYIYYLWDNVILAQWLPFSNLVILGNWLPPASAFLAGVAWHRVPGKVWRKSAAVLMLSATGVYAAAAPLLGTPPECENSWTSDEICLQTSSQTCSAACAATLLRSHGIPATESEMARLCLTREGTTWQGLYHGLKRKAAGTDWDVEVFQCSFKELKAKESGPIILAVGVEEGAEVDPAYTTEFGWIPGTLHSVVFFGFTADGRIAEMGDPTVGREIWKKEDLQTLWQGRGLRLLKK